MNKIRLFVVKSCKFAFFLSSAMGKKITGLHFVKFKIHMKLIIGSPFNALLTSNYKVIYQKWFIKCQKSQFFKNLIILLSWQIIQNWLKFFHNLILNVLYVCTIVPLLITCTRFKSLVFIVKVVQPNEFFWFFELSKNCCFSPLISSFS